MKAVLISIALLLGLHVAQAQDNPSLSAREKIQKFFLDLIPENLSRPPMPDFSLPSMPDLSEFGAGIMGEFSSFTEQVGETLPLLEEMGYEVSTFRVQWGLPPRAKLRLRSKHLTDPAKLDAITAKATGGTLMKALVFSASTAKRIQSNMKFGTAIIDVDFALTPKIRMSFLNGKTDRKDMAERDVEDIDLACGQAFPSN
jgi:hypothetical protein